MSRGTRTGNFFGSNHLFSVFRLPPTFIHSSTHFHPQTRTLFPEPTSSRSSHTEAPRDPSRQPCPIGRNVSGDGSTTAVNADPAAPQCARHASLGPCVSVCVVLSYRGCGGSGAIRSVSCLVFIISVYIALSLTRFFPAQQHPIPLFGQPAPPSLHDAKKKRVCPMYIRENRSTTVLLAFLWNASHQDGIHTAPFV